MAAFVTIAAMSSCGAAIAPMLMGGLTGASSVATTSMYSSGKNVNAKTKSKKTAANDKNQKKVLADALLSHDDSLRYNYYFLEAIRQQNAGHYDAAYDLLRRSLDINPQGAEAWYYLSMYQSEMDQDSLARQSLEHAASLSPKNSTYQERLGQYFLHTRDYASAKAVYEQLADDHHTRTDVLRILLQLYQQDKDYRGMLSAIERIERVEGKGEEFTLAKMHVYELMGDKKSAWQALKSLSDEHPSDLNYRVMMGNWLMQNERQKEALKLFTAALREEPDNAYAQSSMYDYYRATGQDSLARQTMRAIVLSPKSTTENKSSMIRQAVKENEEANGDSTEILQLFDDIMAVNPNDSDMMEMKVAYMNLKKMPEDSIATALRQLLAIMPENAGARLQLLGTHLRRQQYSDVASLCHEGTLYNPDEMVFYYYEGLAYYNEDRRDDALATFQRGVSQINSESNAELVGDLYYFMGDLLHQRDRDKEAFAAYDSCLQWVPEHMACLNNYAYYLCLQGGDLERAEQMSYKTVKADPKNTNALDTYAWILFRQERYAEAKIYIDQALTLELAKVDSTMLSDELAKAIIPQTDVKPQEQKTEEVKKTDEIDDFEAELLGESKHDEQETTKTPIGVVDVSEAETGIEETDIEEADTVDVNEITPSSVVLEHAGDIYAMTGETDRAVELWNLALEYTPDRQAIIEKKIRLRKYMDD